MAFTLKFGWTKDSLEDMPTPKYEGWKISREKVWNAKAGRSSKALYNGKIVAKKVTLDMAFPANLTPSEIKKLMKYADPDDLSNRYGYNAIIEEIKVKKHERDITKNTRNGRNLHISRT